MRHPKWFEEKTYEEHVKFLHSNNIGMVIDDLLKTSSCTPKMMVRVTPTGDLSQIDRWYDKIVEWTEKGLKELYFFFAQGKISNQQLEALQYFKQRII